MNFQICDIFEAIKNQTQADSSERSKEIYSKLYKLCFSYTANQEYVWYYKEFEELKKINFYMTVMFAPAKRWHLVAGSRACSHLC